MNDIEELYPSECDVHYSSDYSHESMQDKLSSSDSEALYPSDEDVCFLPSVPVSNELDEISRVLVSSCCENKCVFFLYAHDVITARENFTSLGANGQRQWLTDKMNENSHIASDGKLSTQYSVAGREVCQAAWCNVHSLSPKRISRILKAVANGEKIVQQGKKRFNSKTTGVKAWMERYFHLIGDKMPHNNQVHLPSWETHKDFYERYVDDMKLQEIPEEEMVALSTFYKIWKNDFPNVVIPEVSDNS
jgi:hypothetical protein